MNKTGIEYLSHTWNPIAMRCTRVSAGCQNCWHLRTAVRHANNKTIRPAIREARGGGEFALLEDELGAPLKLRKPARIGVQFMGDLFHESISLEWIARVFEAMAAETHHTYLLLTKRPDRMRAMLGYDSPLRAKYGRGTWCDRTPEKLQPYIWLGVSVEDQATADERIPELLKIPAAVRFVSYEPALGPVDFLDAMPMCDECGGSGEITDPDHDLHPSRTGDGENETWCPVCTDAGEAKIFGLDWAIAGAETGLARRNADHEWFRKARDQCRATAIPFFFKKDSQGRRELDGVLHEAMP